MKYVKTYENFQAGSYKYLIMYNEDHYYYSSKTNFRMNHYLSPIGEPDEWPQGGFMKLLNEIGYDTHEEAKQKLDWIKNLLDSNDLSFANVDVEESENLGVVRWFVGTYMEKEDNPEIGEIHENSDLGFKIDKQDIMDKILSMDPTQGTKILKYLEASLGGEKNPLKVLKIYKGGVLHNKGGVLYDEEIVPYGRNRNQFRFVFYPENRHIIISNTIVQTLSKKFDFENFKFVTQHEKSRKAADDETNIIETIIILHLNKVYGFDLKYIYPAKLSARTWLGDYGWKGDLD